MTSTTGSWFVDEGAREEWPDGEDVRDVVLDIISDVLYVVDRRGQFVDWNDRFCERTGYTDTEIVDLHQFDIIPDTAEDEAGALLGRVADGEEVALEAPLVTSDGEQIPHEFTAAPLQDDDGEVWGMVGTARDISNRKERTALFEQLHDGMRRLMAAETTSEVATVAASVIQDYFDSATTAVRLLRDDQLELVATEATEEYGDLILPTYEVGEGFIGEAYEAGEPAVYDDLREVDTPIDYDPARSVMVLPIPGYGLISVAATEPGVFDETDRELGRLFTADAEAAFERAEREQRLRERKRELEQYETLVETMGDGVYATDENNTVTMVNDSLLEMAGYDREAVIGRQATEFGQMAAERQRRARESLSDSSEVGQLEDVFERPDGERIHVENRFSLLPSDDGFRGTVGVIRDITDRKERETLVRDLHGLSRDLLTAETKQAVAERATAAADQLGFPMIAVRLFDDEGRLAIAARQAEMDAVGEGELPAYEVGEGVVGRAYERGEPTIYDDLTDESMKYDPSPIRSALFLPVEDYGLISIGSTEAGAFDETDRELGRLFAADVESALARADREQRLKAQRDELETLNRINELVRETIGALATAPTREEIETTVVERLADSSLYQLAVTGTRPPDGDYLEYTARAGDGAEYLDRVEIPVGADSVGTVPAADALERGETRVTRDLAAESVFEPFREAALENDLRSIADIPLRHGEVVHGLLAVYADRPDAFSDREIRAFEVLGEMVGFAISATQNRRLVESDSRLELTFRLTRPPSPIARLAADLDSPCRLLGSAETNDSGVLHYVSVRAADEDAVLESLRDSDARVRDQRIVRATDDDVVVEIRSTESVPTVLLDLGLRPTEVRADGETVDVVVEAPQDCDVRAVIARLEEYGDVTLVSKQLVEEWTGPAETVREDLHETLTDRQQAALNAAYFGGYFDWPRDSTAEEVADSLDISSATLHQHLRHAQRKVLAAYVADSLPDPD